jgi:hypothetical protein
MCPRQWRQHRSWRANSAIVACLQVTVEAVLMNLVAAVLCILVEVK